MKPLAVVAVEVTPGYPDAEARVLDRLTLLKRDWPTHDWLVVSERELPAARKLKLKTYVIPPDEHLTDLAAGVARTQRVLEVPIARVGDPSRVICFWDFAAGGTRTSIREAMMNHRAVEIWDADYEPAGPEAAEAVFESA